MSNAPSQPQMSVAHRIVIFPLRLMVIGFVYVTAAAAAIAALLHLDGQTGEDRWWSPFIYVPVLLLVYVQYVRVFERRRANELELVGAVREFGLGYLLGGGLFTAVIGVLWLLGLFEIIARHSAFAMLSPFLWMIMHAVLEELIFRGLIFRLLEHDLGSVAALLISAALFGAAHIFNPGASVASSVAIAIEAGFLLGVIFMLTRRLWICIGFHAAWNIVQGGVFSVPLSGNEFVGLFDGRLRGANWLSGRVFGAEASAASVVICLSIAVVLYRLVQRRGGDMGRTGSAPVSARATI